VGLVIVIAVASFYLIATVSATAESASNHITCIMD
jgi:hypothetical protein